MFVYTYHTAVFEGHIVDLDALISEASSVVSLLTAADNVGDVVSFEFFAVVGKGGLGRTVEDEEAQRRVSCLYQ